MEIHPERIPQEEKQEQRVYEARWTTRRVGPLSMLIFGAVGLALIVLLFFFMFWAVVIFAVLGAVALLVQTLRSLLGGSPAKPGGGVRVYGSIEREKKD